jgi:hypothetical protein
MKPVVFSTHAAEQLADRGTDQAEVEEAIRMGEREPGRWGRWAFRKNFPFGSQWKGKVYNTKQVRAIVADEPEHFVVVTVYVYYFGEET